MCMGAMCTIESTVVYPQDTSTAVAFQVFCFITNVLCKSVVQYEDWIHQFDHHDGMMIPKLLYLILLRYQYNILDWLILAG
jgi:hypothetical protein